VIHPRDRASLRPIRPVLLALFGATVVVVATPGLSFGAQLMTCGDDPTDGCYEIIQDAIDAAEDDDDILVVAGDYAQTVVLDHRRLDLIRPGSTGGGGTIFGTGSTDPTVTIIGGTVKFNFLYVASANGPAIVISDGADVQVNNSLLKASALQRRGGVLQVSDSILTVHGTSMLGGRAVGGGGQLVATNSDVTLSTSSFTAGQAVAGGAVAVTSDDGKPIRLTVNNCRFLDNTAAAYGAAIIVDGRTGRSDIDVTIRDSRFEGNRAEGLLGRAAAGAVLIANTTGEVLLKDNVFQDNQAGVGASGIQTFWTGPVFVHRNLFCANGPILSTDKEAVLDVTGASSLDVRNNQFLESRHSAIQIRSTSTAMVQNNHFIGNTAQHYPVLHAVPGGDGGADVGVIFTDNLVAANVGTDLNAQQLLIPDEGRKQLDHNLWWNNQPEQPVVEDANDVRADPLIRGYLPGQPCLNLASNSLNVRDPLWPSWYGPTRDAGSDRDVDRDGSPLEIGAFGGSTARESPDWDDRDGDGVPGLYDCDRADAEIGSGLDDAPYNGIDEDCRADDDFDADDDGARPLEHALDDGLVDCDDADPRRHSGLTEIPSNGIDDDCDGWADNTGVLSVGSCSVIPASSLAWLVGLVLLAGRRRRESLRKTALS
jgi:MYXO-CTERM domain-containing protein